MGISDRSESVEPIGIEPTTSCMPGKIEACEISLAGYQFVNVGCTHAAERRQILDAPTVDPYTLMRHARSESWPMSLSPM